MDLDHILAAIEVDDFKTTDEFDDRQEERSFSLAQVMEAIRQGRIIREEPGRGGLGMVYTVRGMVQEDQEGNQLSQPVPLEIAVAVPGEVVLITAYWPRE